MLCFGLRGFHFHLKILVLLFLLLPGTVFVQAIVAAIVGHLPEEIVAAEPYTTQLNLRQPLWLAWRFAGFLNEKVPFSVYINFDLLISAVPIMLLPVFFLCASLVPEFIHGLKIK